MPTRMTPLGRRSLHLAPASRRKRFEPANALICRIETTAPAAVTRIIMMAAIGSSPSTLVCPQITRPASGGSSDRIARPLRLRDPDGHDQRPTPGRPTVTPCGPRVVEEVYLP